MLGNRNVVVISEADANEEQATNELEAVVAHPVIRPSADLCYLI